MSVTGIDKLEDWLELGASASSQHYLKLWIHGSFSIILLKIQRMYHKYNKHNKYFAIFTEL
jgi:hypothetical protein